MSIPRNIRKEHILKALSEIDNHGVPDERNSSKFNLLYEGNQYPPKYVLSLANKYANGHELHPTEFNGGKQTNKYLSDRGFEIISNEKNDLVNHSWTILSPIIAVKEMDKLSFLHKGTGIPMDMRYFFDLGDMEKGEKRITTLIYNDSQFEGHFIMDKTDNPRTRLFWSGDLAKAILNDFPDEYIGFKNGTLAESNIQMRFTNRNDNEYEVFIASEIDSKQLQKYIKDIESEVSEEDYYYQDGAIRYYYGKRYERNPINRQKAIEIHGTICMACGFNFEDVYGEHGKDFIEVHHVKQLSTVKEEMDINPKEDLVTLCSNCHRMVHRNRDQVLSIEELRAILLKK
jgi:5-methylcytosine-specific restriction enzyme A